MSHHTHNSQCPHCAKEGKDKDGNNLGNYSDGSAWCFSCSYYKPPEAAKAIKEKTYAGNTTTTTAIYLPRDLAFELPTSARDFLRKYSLTERDINVNRIMWSDEWQRLVFPYFNGTGLLGWQGRYLGNQSGKAKWYSQGNLKDIKHVCGSQRADLSERSLVLVEDIISAIRVGHSNPCSPLFGSHLSINSATRYALGVDKLILWLDLDKQEYSIKTAKKLNELGITTSIVITELDPKEYQDDAIKEILDKVREV